MYIGLTSLCFAALDIKEILLLPYVYAKTAPSNLLSLEKMPVCTPICKYVQKWHAAGTAAEAGSRSEEEVG